MNVDMNAEQRERPNPRHQPETVSTASLQAFEDPEGGLPVDSPEAKAREQQSRGRPGRIHPPQASSDDKPVSLGA
ncbi:MAG: hypothetical protein U0793_27105 [Gemmataceae bacterium]